MLADATLTIASNAVVAAITHAQLHSGARGAAGTTNAIGTRVAFAGSVDGDGDITWTGPFNFTGLGASTAVQEISFWSASSGGTYRGGGTLTGDTTANAAGEYTVTSWVENLTSA